ncbi:olfactory receptor 14I1-like [Passerculus sandwichensis]
MLEEALSSRQGTVAVIHINSHDPVKGYFQIGNDKVDAAAKGDMLVGRPRDVYIPVPEENTWQLQLLHFCLLLGISLAALLGNGLIISAVACGHHLHTPMFFFLLNLALSDLGSICTTVPKAMHNSLWDTRDISYKGCAAQAFFFLFFISAELSLLTIMCYDRYVSICKPLHYGTLLDSRACAHMAAAAWTVST